MDRKKHSAALARKRTSPDHDPNGYELRNGILLPARVVAELPSVVPDDWPPYSYRKPATESDQQPAPKRRRKAVRAPYMHLYDCDAAMRAVKAFKGREDDGPRADLRALADADSRRRLQRLTPRHIRRVEALHRDYPNFSCVIDHVVEQLSLAALEDQPYAGMAPLLLYGEPGLGKSRFCRALSEALMLPMLDLPMNSITAGFELQGTASSWSSAKAGRFAEFMLASEKANPIFYLDELDKLQSRSNFPPEMPLYQLMEPRDARHYRDEYFGLQFDLSKVLIICTANELGPIPTPLLNRLTVQQVHMPTRDQRVAIVQSVYRDLRNHGMGGKRFSPKLGPDVVECLSGLCPREIVQVLDRARARIARLRGQHDRILRIRLADVQSITIGRKPRIGFS